MRLPELCEPLFACICALSRQARAGADLEMTRTRTQIEAILKNMREQAEADAMLRAQYDRVEIVLMYFVDSTIRHSELPFARQWEMLALRHHSQGAGESDFFERLDADLQQEDPGVNERLEIFYTCLGLGFKGMYRDHPGELRMRMQQLSARVGAALGSEQQVLCPEAYEHVDDRAPSPPIWVPLWAMMIVVVGLLVVTFMANAWMYRATSADLAESLNRVTTHRAPRTAPAPVSPAGNKPATGVQHEPRD